MKTKRVLWFVRHGERVDNVNPEWKKTAKKWDDPPLSPRGHLQAVEVGIRLAPEDISLVICSPFTRCIQTATDLLSQRKDTVPVYIEPGMGESMNACAFPPGNPTLDEICQMSQFVEPSYQPIFPSVPPETGGDGGCAYRIECTIRKVLEKFPKGNILFVSHGSPIAASHLALMGDWKYVGQCTIGKIVVSGDQFVCEYYGSKDHLSDQTNLRDCQRKEQAHQIRMKFGSHTNS